MDEKLKKRLVGATVLVSLVVIFVPMLLEDEPMVETGIQKTNIPPKPERDFSSRVIPAEDEKLSIPPIAHRPEIVPLKPPPPPPAPVVVEKPEPPAPSSTPSDAAEQTETKPPAVAPREGLTAWVIQVGSFSNRENAEKLVQQIREMKYAAFMEQADVDGKTLYRVKVGPEVDRKLADKMLVSLNKDLKPLNLKGAVKSYP
ncbi:SPOR domain-containing protein [Sedimenticola sp.]|uniref:SPOR domain-containing protein n=1 Tax=Sedimenticola sp. TaxID=1940285 RepID=UPI00258C8A17|nr:SPOR domain-containing protein [Sedimenticola sp.]MCW8904328.1 SPOR domain-containing protein [Sedimenticola sp.]